MELDMRAILWRMSSSHSISGSLPELFQSMDMLRTVRMCGHMWRMGHSGSEEG